MRQIRHHTRPVEKSAGKRLYLYSSIDHEALFRLLEVAAGDVMFTYDDAKEVRNLAAAHGFSIARIPMKTTHHTRMYELAITNRPFAVANTEESWRLLEQCSRYKAKRQPAQYRDEKT